MRRLHLICLAAGALAAWALAPAANADLISIDFTGLHLTFDGGNIYDASDPTGGNGLTGEATELGSITFSKNYVPVEGPSGSVYADVLIQNVPPIPDTGYVSSSGGTFVDLLSAGSEPLLQLSIDAMYVYMTGPNLVSISGIASGVTSQNLPSELVIDPDDQINIILNCDTYSNPITDGEGRLMGFEWSSGTGQIAGTAVPEPGSLVLLLCLAASALAGRWFIDSRKTNIAIAGG